MMRRALAALGLSLVAGLAAVPTAEAVTGSPPVTTPDSVTIYAGNVGVVKPVNNDTDPDNEQLALCRLGTEHYKGIEVAMFDYEVGMFVKPRVKPGTYTFTYYACDYSYLTPGTITLTVKELPKITVRKIANRPGRLRVTNPADFKIRFLYGSFKEDRPDGRVLIAKGASVVIPVHRTRIDWVAVSRDGEIYLGSGHVTNIKLPPGDRRPARGVTLPARLAEAWHRAA
jgi:hypothetical protein